MTRISPLPALLEAPGLRAVLRALPRARLVGGCVRDILACAAFSDIDLATPDAPDEVVRLLKRAKIRAIPTGIAHGTAHHVGGKAVFLQTCRDPERRAAYLLATDAMLCQRNNTRAGSTLA